jgi:hypothetical protein
VDQSIGSERTMILSRDDHVEVTRLTPPLFSYLSALAARHSLGEAMGMAGMDEAALLGGLHFTFAQSLVVGISLQSAKR